MARRILSEASEEEGAPPHFVWCDETYIDYVEDAESLEYLIGELPRLIVCKSMSKCYALSGMRVAYLVSTHFGSKLRRFIPPWSVSLPAQLAAMAALESPDYYRTQYKEVNRQRVFVQQELQALGFRVVSGCANFLLTFLPDEARDQYDSESFIQACRDTGGVYLRNTQNMGKNMPNNGVRFAIRSSEENRRILKCVREVLGRSK